MKFLAGLFGKHGQDGEAHRWSLNPYQAHYRAGMTVKSAKRLGVELDYSPKSLADVDMLIDKERETGIGLTKEMSEVLLSLGSYVGEVMVRNMNATWAEGAVLPTQDPLLILVDGKFAINVISLVFHRFISGPPHSMAAMYEEAEKMREKE